MSKLQTDDDEEHAQDAGPWNRPFSPITTNSSCCKPRLRYLASRQLGTNVPTQQQKKPLKHWSVAAACAAGLPRQMSLDYSRLLIIITTEKEFQNPLITWLCHQIYYIYSIDSRREVTCHQYPMLPSFVSFPSTNEGNGSRKWVRPESNLYKGCWTVQAGF